MVEMDAFHVLLSRPWQFDKRVIHNGKANTYSFKQHQQKIILLPYKPNSNTNPKPNPPPQCQAMSDLPPP